MDALWLTEDENRVLRKAIALALTMYENRPPRLPDFENPDEDGYFEWLCDQLHQLERRCCGCRAKACCRRNRR